MAPPTPRSTSTTVPWLDPVEGDQIYGGPAPGGGSKPGALPNSGSTASPVPGPPLSPVSALEVEGESGACPLPWRPDLDEGATAAVFFHFSPFLPFCFADVMYGSVSSVLTETEPN